MYKLLSKTLILVSILFVSTLAMAHEKVYQYDEICKKPELPNPNAGCITYAYSHGGYCHSLHDLLGFKFGVILEDDSEHSWNMDGFEMVNNKDLLIVPGERSFQAVNKANGNILFDIVVNLYNPKTRESDPQSQACILNMKNVKSLLKLK